MGSTQTTTAHEETKGEKRRMTTESEGPRPAWFVGAAFGGFDDQTERFIQDGIWGRRSCREVRRSSCFYTTRGIESLSNPGTPARTDYGSTIAESSSL